MEPASFVGEERMDALTERELDVLRRLAHGQTVGGIAKALGVSENTVKSHLRSVYEKLGVRSRAAAAEWYWRRFTQNG